MNLYTVGTEGKPASQFFPLLQSNGIKRVIDVRLINNNVYSGYSKKGDLQYFLSLFGIDYYHSIESAPDKTLLKAWHDNAISWDEYIFRYLSLIDGRGLSLELKDNDCLLCFEKVPDCCHRLILSELLKAKNSGLVVVHL